MAAAVVAGSLLPELERAGSGPVELGFGGTPEGARAVLSVVASSTITVTALTFSLTVVALQVASSQFTPRLLGTFLSDRGNQAVLSVFLGTFAYSLIVLRSVRSASEGRAGPFVPDVAVAAGLVLALLSVGMLVYFFHHLTQQFRVESVLAGVRDDTLGLIHRHVPGRDQQQEVALPPVPERATALRAPDSGYLQAVEPAVLLAAATDHGVTVRLRPLLGTHVTTGTTLAWAWPVDGRAAGGGLESEKLTGRLRAGIQLGPDRTLQQDVAFGVRQLADIATRALSPGINDPTTAVDTIGALASVLSELACRRLAPVVCTDEQGRVRAAVDQPSFAEILALACDQPRRYGATEPAVLTELLRMLTDLAEVGPREVAEAVGGQVEATVETAETAGLTGPELARVRRLARHARAALEQGCRVAETPSPTDEPAP